VRTLDKYVLFKAHAFDGKGNSNVATPRVFSLDLGFFRPNLGFWVFFTEA